MQKLKYIIFSLLFAVFLAGCSSQQTFGNFSEEQSASLQQAMAEDALRQLKKVYPPATTRFNLMHNVADPFGNAFVEGLRSSGYAIAEVHPDLLPKAVAERAVEVTRLITAEQGIPLSYIVDHNSGLFHLSLRIKNKTISRGYMVSDGALHPASAWTVKE